MDNPHTQKPRVLLVDDTPQNLHLLGEMLSSLDIEIFVASDGQKCLDIAATHHPVLILLDVMMPNMDGFEVCRRLKANPDTASIPVIFVTAKTEDVAIGFSVGGADYITKPVRQEEVLARVSYQLDMYFLQNKLTLANANLEEKVRERTAELTLLNFQLREEINERRYLQDRLSYLASHDFVTKAHNVSALNSHCSHLLAKVQLNPQIAADFILLDISQFKSLSESFGYVAGDEVLRQFTDLVSAQLDKGDFFARIGGDKFGIVRESFVGDGSTVSSEVFLKGLIETINEHKFIWNSYVIKLQISSAIVGFSTEIFSFDHLMLIADEVLFECKREKSGVLVYTPKSNDDAQHRHHYDWAVTILDALEHDHFRVYFQCQYPVNATQAKLRFETLVRMWDNKNNSLILPGNFIKSAERFMLISELDRWMIKHVFEFFNTHRELIPSIDKVSINLSAVSLREPHLCDFILNLLLSYDLPGSMFCFEITETEAIINIAKARGLMERLKEAGCYFALDDFGSGFASFSYLKDLPFDYIKIDGVFIREMDTDPTQLALVKSMVEMAHRLDKPVVAEYVENTTVLDRLSQLNVEWAQGFALHKPEELTVLAINNKMASS
ncbi:EAL domain-containing protein [Leeia sp. TBRC 13508]|uniref:EAL domain-containing protein n=1 Tax=Leeia speluncae TaxID=2884804 RepID=A0ABS8D8M2_9NEIS|nr:EAL domain-containing protein [Leeia speluncae]MCB6184545.1 EAL domain-containing protein [Leeia speluncae]